MLYQTNHRNIVVLLILSILSMLVFANFDLTKSLCFSWNENSWSLPVPILFPVFYVFLCANIHYLKFSYAEGKNIPQKLFFGFLNSAITITIFIAGFEFWKRTQGDVDVAFFRETKNAFELTFRNIYFWTCYQTLLLVYAVSVLKIMVSRLPKK
jgi:hypothetical protein